MFDQYILCEEGFRATADGAVVQVRMPYYRGLGLSMVEAVDLTFDGVRIPAEHTTLTVHGHTYSFAEMPGVTNDRWEMGEPAELAFTTDTPVTAGEHEVGVSVRLRISYMPVPGGGRDTKRLSTPAEASA